MWPAVVTMSDQITMPEKLDCSFVLMMMSMMGRNRIPQQKAATAMVSQDLGEAQMPAVKALCQHVWFSV